MQPSAKIIADSTYENGTRVTTMEVVLHRFVLAELNTHRAFSRNSASSRAIPVRKQLERVRNTPAIPLVFPAERKGMQGGEALSEDEQRQALTAWLTARDAAADAAEMMVAFGVHKSVTNRLLEPFMWHTAVLTSVDFQNFFVQRCSPLAQPEIQAVAYAMRDALEDSEPNQLARGDFHMPYLDGDTIAEVAAAEHNVTDVLAKVSAARCARVSYLTQSGKRDYQEDLSMYERLVEADPPHWSPLEHVCRPHQASDGPLSSIPGNLPGWVQIRHIVSGEV